MGFADFPFQSRFREVQGHRMHYIDEGQGPVLLFLHGNPTSSYLWRNVIKPLSKSFRCIAPDLIGFGRSDKPELDYRFHTHYRFLEAFHESMHLEDVTLVVHDWGGPLGFELARNHPGQISGICFMETFPFTMTWSEFPGPARPLFRAFRKPLTGKLLIMWQNLFVNLVLPWSVKRHLPHSVMATYRAPFRKVRDRFPIYVWPNELPLEDRRNDTWQTIQRIEEGLADMPQRLLLLRFRPGAILRKRRVEWLKERIPHLDVADCGFGLHFVQEDQPETIAANIEAWMREQPGPGKPEPEGPPGVRTTPHETRDFNGTLYWRTLPRGEETMLAGWSDQGLVLLQFLEPGEEPEALVRTLFPDADIRERGDDDTDWLAESTPLHLVGTDFQRRVWKALREIPAGATLTYKALGEQVGSQPRAVGQAVAHNPIALRIPCHRVVPVSGGPGQYRWGKARKKALLEAGGAG